MTKPEAGRYDVCVVGSGMAGLSAALFAVSRGLSTAVVGRTGELIFATGLLDLLGVHPVAEGRAWSDPWAGIAALVGDNPFHPYARIPPGVIRSAFEELLAFFESFGLPYAGHAERNVKVLTSAGTRKITFRVPATMWAGVEALERRAPVLLVDIRGLKGFSARQIAAVSNADWPAIETVRIGFDDMHLGGDVFPERMARVLENAPGRERFAAALAPHVQQAAVVGVPALLGITGSAAVMQEISGRIGRPLFEIPTMPPGVTGLRLRETFERGLSAKGARLYLENRVFRAAADPQGGFRLEAGSMDAEFSIQSAGLILATGRFMGGGLQADRRGVREALFGLPVHQPPGREDWHRAEFLDRRGHPVNRAGIEIDDDFRPLNGPGRPFHPRLFAAGSILAHQDWMRMKCGSGLAIATAAAAVQSLVRTLRADPA
jgi:glycerol-3-phosphate dehydrogenase subunit B